MTAPTTTFTVELPAGGRLELKTAEEVTLWEQSKRSYTDDYGIHKHGDLVLVGAILTQHLYMYRAQLDLTDPKKAPKAQGEITKTAAEIRELEKALGIDKKTREQGGQHTTADYLANLKKAAHLKGIEISERVKEYERVLMEASWKIRLLRNGDAEDRAHHGVSSEKEIVAWLEREIEEIEKKRQKWAAEKGAIFVGKL